MNYDNMLKRFRESPLGRAETAQKLSEFWNHPEMVPSPFVADFNEKRIFLFDEFFNKKGPHHLHWHDIAGLSIFDGGANSMIYFMNIGGKGTNNFRRFFGKLLDQLVSDNIMRCNYDPIAGDYLINGRGISVEKVPIRECDSMGNPLVNIYYPREESDALEYAKAFCSGYATISKTVKHFCCS